VNVRPRVVRRIWAGVVAAVLVAVLALFVFPTRTYFDQRHELAVASQRLRVLDGQNAQLSQQVDKLHTDAEIERIAREQYHLVKPGEKAFAVLPAPEPTTTTAVPPVVVAPAPATPPSHHRGWWDRLTSWL
jgi:cell division protein FtsB